jgi:hypothetical protein
MQLAVYAGSTPNFGALHRQSVLSLVMRGSGRWIGGYSLHPQDIRTNPRCSTPPVCQIL